MADIFISYSSKDRQQAEQLTELLASAGLSVWIDQAGLEVSNSWSKEIVAAINDCKAFLVLLSPNSLESHNVIKEVSLASEKRKKILPLELEPITLTEDFEYQLAGIHRTSMTNIDSIIRALGKLGLEATQAPTLKLVKETDSRKSLMILPFEDLSPTGDNSWFADGIVSELISVLTSIKALRVSDQQATKDYNRYSGTLPVYAKETGVRYFVQGDVRKFGDNIKITSRLLDIETGDHLWQDSLKGTMEDIFDIQEQVAKRVLEGLQVLLTSEEQSKLEERGTNNADAYEFYIRSSEVFALNTLEGHRQARTLAERAIEIDPSYVAPYTQKAQVILRMFENYERDIHLLDEAQALLEKAESISVRPILSSSKADILRLRGDVEGAERTFKEMIGIDPNNCLLYNGLGYFYYTQGRHNEAFEMFVNSIKHGANHRAELWNTSFNAYMAEKHEDFFYWSEKAIPEFKKYTRLYPDDLESRRVLAWLLFFRDEKDESLRELEIIESKPNLDAIVLFHIASLRAARGEYTLAIERLRESVSAGFMNKNSILNGRYLKPLLTMPEFTALMEEMDRRIAAIGSNG